MIIVNRWVIGAIRTSSYDKEAEWAVELGTIARWLTELCAEKVGKRLAKEYVLATVKNAIGWEEWEKSDSLEEELINGETETATD